MDLKEPYAKSLFKYKKKNCSLPGLSKFLVRIKDVKNNYLFLFQHSAEATHCDKDLTSQLKNAADSTIRELSSHVLGDMPVLMSGAGHDAMAKLTKVCE